LDVGRFLGKQEIIVKVKIRIDPAAAARRAEQLATWVAEHGDQSTQGRFRIGMLPETEVLDRIRDQAYRPLAEFRRYRKIRWCNIEHTDECYSDYGDQNVLECDTEPADALTAEEFDTYTALDQAAPADATLETLAHACECRTCGAGLIRKSVRVQLTVGELEFSREYTLS
jgi:hypothetical protein